MAPPPPRPCPRIPTGRWRDIDDRGVGEVVARALRNYLAGDANQLVADLAPGVAVTLPTHALRMATLETLKWGRDGGSVVAVVTARASDEAWTLRYELDVTRVAGRWEIAAIETRSGY